MERSAAEAFVNDKLNEINDSVVKGIGGVAALNAETSLRLFDSLDKVELIQALEEEGVPPDAVSEDEADKLFNEGMLGDVYDIAEKHLPERPAAE